MSNGCAVMRRCSSATGSGRWYAKAARRRPSRCATEEALSLRCDSAARVALEEAERGLRALERSAEREDPEADPGEQQRDPDDEAEERELRCHVARVQR